MSQTSKRPGAKDISELKARLGLKKSGPAAATTKSGGGVMAPPGSRTSGVIPAPPGAHPPRPVIPDAKEDPFGAMNAMAAHGAVAAQPQIIVVNDGMPGERVEKRSSAVKFGIMGAVFLVPLILGTAIGNLGSGAKAYNRTIADAALVRDDTNKVRDALVAIQTVLQAGRERSRGTGFVPNDAKLTAELAAAPPLSPNIEVVFKSHLYELDAALVAAILSFYVEALELNDMIKKHVQASRDGEKIIKEGQTRFDAYLQQRYAALLDVPNADQAKSGKPVSIKLVQVGSPVCEGQSKPSDAGCGAANASGFRFRADEQGAWGVKKIAKPEEGSVAGDTLVLIDPDTKALQQLVKGGQPSLTESAYLDRITRINERVNKLLESQNAIKSRLNNHANKSPEFTFFM